MESLFKDIRYAARSLVRHPGFALAAVLTLALGIGVNTALFTIFNVLVLKPLPITDPQSVVHVTGINEDGQNVNNFSYLEYLDYRDRNQTLSALALMNKVAMPLGEARLGRDDFSPLRDEYVYGQIVSANYFPMLGAQMELGRSFLPEEERTPLTHPVIVLSHSFWQRHFKGDEQVVGKQIKLHGQSFTVVGVTAKEFVGTTPDTPQCWIPLMMRDAVIPTGHWNHKYWLTERKSGSFNMLGRLKLGITQSQAQAELNLIRQHLATEHPEVAPTGSSLRVSRNPGFIALSTKEWAQLMPLPLAVGFVLLIACANVANLMLARAAMRQKEIGVRLALGASRWQVIRLLLTESLLVSVTGGLLGLGLASWTLSILYPLVLGRLPIPQALRESITVDLAPDYRIFVFTLVVSLVAGAIAGLAPALQSSRPDLVSSLKEEGLGLGRHLSQSHLRNGLIVTQIAFSLMLLIAAALLVRNVQRAGTVDTGMEIENLFSVVVNQDSESPNGPSVQATLRQQLAERLRTVPGVISTSQVLRQPLTGKPASTSITVDDQPPTTRPLRANYNIVSPSHFETVGVQIIRGRSFTEGEARSGAPVVVISESTARKFWPKSTDIGEAIGHRIGIAAAVPETETANHETRNFPSFEIVGIARDTRSGWVWEIDQTYLYVPVTPVNHSAEYILVRTKGDPGRVMATVQNEAANIDPHLRVLMERISANLDLQMTPFRGLAIVALILGLMAMLLAAVGLYGVMSFVIARRTREIGIRVALGAQPRDVVRLILNHGMRLVLVGILVGLAGGVLISRLLSAVLVDLSPLDPIAFGSVSIFLAAVGLVSSWLPARRATKVEPLVALRHE
jgi:predicted permease